MCGNWRLGNDSRVKDAFWPEFQNAVLGRKDAKTALADAERRVDARAAAGLARRASHPGPRPRAARGGRAACRGSRTTTPLPRCGGGVGAGAAPRDRLVPPPAHARGRVGGVFPAAGADDLLPLPDPASRLEPLAVVPCLVAAQAGEVRRPRALPGDAARRRRVLAGVDQHAVLHRRLADRDRGWRWRIALVVNSDLKGAGDLSHDRLPLLPADDGGGRHHLALAL